MPGVRFTLDPDVYEEMVRLIPPRERDRVVNEALRKELRRTGRKLASEMLEAIRRKIGNLGGREIVESLRKDRARCG